MVVQACDSWSTDEQDWGSRDAKTIGLRPQCHSQFKAILGSIMTSSLEIKQSK